MGNWTILITGSDSHRGDEGDADVMARDFVDELAMAGHGIIYACVIFLDENAREEIVPRIAEATEPKE